MEGINVISEYGIPSVHISSTYILLYIMSVKSNENGDKNVLF